MTSVSRRARSSIPARIVGAALLLGPVGFGLGLYGCSGASRSDHRSARSPSAPVASGDPVDPGSTHPAAPRPDEFLAARAAGPPPARSAPQASAASGAPTPGGVPRPRIVSRRIPFGARRRAETVAYVRRHYGSFMAPTYRLRAPRVIVEHFTQTSTFGAVFNTFAPDAADPELHEKPNVCSHFVVDKTGTIYQLVSTSIICRHTVGLNWTAIGIEHVGFSDQEILRNRRQMRSSLALTRWLRCRLHISTANVIGHNESLSSRYHREDVSRLRGQTHDDFRHSSMRSYRARLRTLPCR